MVASHAARRAILREYVKCTLWAEPPEGAAPLPLCLPHAGGLVDVPRDAVLAAFRRLRPRDRQVLQDLAYLDGRAAAKRLHCASLDAVTLARRVAVDALLTELLRGLARRVA